MWRRHSIAARKAWWDAAKSRIYSIIGKKIQIAAKQWGDPKMNPALEMMLDKARYYSLPREVVERAILKGSGQLEWENLEEIMYEWYGPAGTALLIKTVTGNTNRTASSIRTILGKHWWSLWLPNSVARQFKEMGIILLDGIAQTVQDKWKTIEKILPFDHEKIENDLMELPIADFSQEDEKYVVQTSKPDFISVKKSLTGLGYHISEADLHFIADNTVKLSAEDMERFTKLLTAIEEDEDVDAVRHNVENNE